MDPLTAMLIMSGISAGTGILGSALSPTPPDLRPPALNALNAQRQQLTRTGDRQAQRVQDLNAAAGLTGASLQTGMENIFRDHGTRIAQFDAQAADAIVNLTRQQQRENFRRRRDSVDNTLRGISSAGMLLGNYFLSQEPRMPTPISDDILDEMLDIDFGDELSFYDFDL